MSISRKDYYNTLGIKKTATQSDIKKAYRTEMMRFHPDKFTGNKETGLAQTKEIVEAYEILSDSRQKQIYDEGRDPLSEHIDGSSDEYKSSFSAADNDRKQHHRSHYNSKFGFQRRTRKERDPNAPLEIGFDLAVFMETLAALALHGDTIALENYFIENIDNLQSVITTGYQIKDIYYPYLRNTTYCLILHFDATWLRTLDFNQMQVLGGFLNILPIEHWKPFLDHLDSEWLNSLFSGVTLRAIMGCLTGAACMMDSENYRRKQYDTLLSYLGREWLRSLFSNTHQLGDFLEEWDYCNSHSILLDFLNGEDQWIQKTITNGNNLGIILESLSEYQEQMGSYYSMFSSAPKPEPQLNSNTLEKWQSFLSYLNSNWRETILDNPVELNALLHHLDAGFSFYFEGKNKKIALFTETFLNKEPFCQLKQLISVLQPSSPDEKAENNGPLDRAKSLQFIQTFSASQIHKMLLKDRTLKVTLSVIDQHKTKPFYKALLFATTVAYHYEVEQNPTKSTSMWAKTFGYSRQQKLDAAKSLMKSILTDTAIENVPGITSGRLNDLNKRYTESRNPAKTQQTKSSFLRRNVV